MSKLYPMSKANWAIPFFEHTGRGGGRTFFRCSHYPGKIPFPISVGVVVGGRQHTSGTSWITHSWQ